MARMQTLLTTLMALMLLIATLGASYPRKVVGLDIAGFPDRDVLVLRTSGDVPPPAGYHRDQVAATLSFILRGVSADGLSLPAGAGKLIRSVALDTANPDGVAFTVSLASAQLTDPSLFRFSQPSEHVVLLEVFGSSDLRDGAQPITDLEGMLGQAPAAPAGVPTESASAQPVVLPRFDPDRLGITTLDLREAEPSRVLGLAAATGLLNTKGVASVATENLGELKIKPAGQSLANWAGRTPPGEMYLSGTPQQIADFLKRADLALLGSQPSIEQFWAANQPPTRSRPVASGVSPDTRQRLRDDPAGGLYYADFIPGGSTLSDVRVSLPAMSGMNLYDVLDYLSLISGISLVIDPYAFDEPTGSPRAPMPPQPPAGTNPEPGYRSAGQFDPQLGRTGTVRGNLVDVPFDTALRLILETHELEFVVYAGGSGASGGGSRYGKSGKPGGGDDGGYDKPVILVTSRERLEQELAGQNEIDLYQLHYADPTQVTQIMDNLSLLPGTNSGWFIYNGGGGYGGGSGGGGGVGGGGGYGGGGGGGNRQGFDNPSLLVYRGSTREPVYEVVQQAVAGGQNVIRVLLAPEQTGQFVTLFAQQ